MSRIITISRQFGSGGRELGRLLAEELHIAYCDSEIVSEAASRGGYDKDYIAQKDESGFLSVPMPTGRSFTLSTAMLGSRIGMLLKQREAIRAFADGGDCVIVGRCADYILADKNPFNIFVYADMPFKLARCRTRADASGLSDKQLRKKINDIDKSRKRLYEMITGGVWGEKSNYSLCVNTSGIDINTLITPLTEYINAVCDRE